MTLILWLLCIASLYRDKKICAIYTYRHHSKLLSLFCLLNAIQLIPVISLKLYPEHFPLATIQISQLCPVNFNLPLPFSLPSQIDWTIKRTIVLKLFFVKSVYMLVSCVLKQCCQGIHKNLMFLLGSDIGNFHCYRNENHRFGLCDDLSSNIFSKLNKLNCIFLFPI